MPADTSFTRHGFTYRIAGADDDAEIARLLNDNEIPGWVSLSYRTSPHWHRPLARSVKSQTIIGVDDHGKAGGLATRSVQEGFLGHRPARIGWLGQLRIDRPLRHRAHLLRAGFEAIERLLHDPAETPYYFASIIDGNEPARRILEKGLAGFPRFEPVARYRVLAMATSLRRWAGSSDIAPAMEPEELADVAGFLNIHNRNRDLAPHIVPVDLAAGGWSGIAPSDIIVRRQAGEIVAAGAVWNQHPHRSIRVVDYREPLRSLRPLLNMAAPLTGLPILPAVGRDLRQAFLALATVKGNDPAMWIDLVRSALAKARAKGMTMMAVGFCDTDPALPAIARTFRHREYNSTIYRVSFSGGANMSMPPLQNPKVEIGLL